MPIQYQVDTARNLLVMRGSGNLTEQTAVEVIDKAVTETKGAAVHLNVLFLLDEQASLHQIDLAAINRIKSKIEAWLKIYPREDIKIALVATGRVEAAVGELWRAISETKPTIRSQTRTFVSEADALAWLKS